MGAILEAYITNLGKYAEGQLVGETLKFPTTTEEVQALLKRIGVDGVRYEEIFITSFDSDVLGLHGANYDREYGCLPLGGSCYMMDKCWTGAYCRYFREAVLPNDPVLEAALTSGGPAPDTKACPVCGGAFLPDGRTRYCSDACAHAARLKKQRGYMRKYRG